MQNKSFLPSFSLYGENLPLLLLLQAVHSSGQHSISFTLSRNQTVVVEYCHDNNTDMFQVPPARDHNKPFSEMTSSSRSGVKNNINRSVCGGGKLPACLFLFSSSYYSIKG